MNYWEECIIEALDEAGIKATPEQIAIIVGCVEGASENYSQAHGYDCIPNHMQQENKELREKLKKEQEKVTCPECKGTGEYVSRGPYHSASGTCFKCHGEGRI